MWAQLMKVQLKAGTDLTEAAGVLMSYEQPDSGLLREIFMQAQNGPDRAYILAVFESEEKARAREQDPRREEGQQAMRDLTGRILAGPPEFVDLTVATEWVPSG
jgi:hypothetical protein